jgi:hypothetical protein
MRSGEQRSSGAIAEPRGRATSISCKGGGEATVRGIPADCLEAGQTTDRRPTEDRGSPGRKYGLAVKPAHKRWLTDVCGLHSRPYTINVQRLPLHKRAPGERKMHTRGLSRDILTFP